MEKSLKKISVIVPNYNYAHYLPSRIESIISQTYPIHELIILDDCSKDNSIEVIRNIVAKHQSVNIKVEVNTDNSGSVFKQWTKGIELAEGDYIWIAEADDLCEENFLEGVMHGFHLNDKVMLSYCQSQKIDSVGNVLSKDCLEYTNEVDFEKWKHSYLRSGVEEICDSLLFKNTIPNASSVVFKKIDVQPIAEEISRYKLCGDWRFYIWLLEKGNIYFCPESLNSHRFHSGSVRESVTSKEIIDETLLIRDNISKNFTLCDELIAKLSAANVKIENFYKYENFLKHLSEEMVEFERIGIYGTKSAANMATKFLSDNNLRPKVLCFIEVENDARVGSDLNGIPIVTLEQAKLKYDVETVIIASYTFHETIYNRIKHVESEGIQVFSLLSLQAMERNNECRERIY